MKPPIGPSLEIVFLLSELTFGLTAEGVARAWRHWGGPGRADRKLAQLEQRGLVSMAPGGTDRIVRLTELGRLQSLGGRDPIRQWSRPWDGAWRVVLFDVPQQNEALRARLRRTLRSLSFGYLQNSVWISPDSPDALRGALSGVAVDVETLTLLEARPCGGESNRDLVRGAWDFDRVNRRYADHCTLLRQHPTQPYARSPAAWTRWLAREWQAWLRAVRGDPLLPDLLLPADYAGKQAWALRMKTLRAVPLAVSATA